MYIWNSWKLFYQAKVLIFLYHIENFSVSKYCIRMCWDLNKEAEKSGYVMANWLIWFGNQKDKQPNVQWWLLLTVQPLISSMLQNGIVIFGMIETCRHPYVCIGYAEL